VKLQDQLEQDIKTAMLARDKDKAEVLRGLKNALHIEAIGLGVKVVGLNDEQAQKVLAAEAKKRQDAADAYQKAGEIERADREMAEKELIQNYLPDMMSDDELQLLISATINRLKASGQADLGRVISAVRAETGASADGATVARLVRELLERG
jgi:uncharacterized protein YqeY